MNLFDKKFVHFMWDEELKGKKVFYEDSIDNLIYDVENDSIRDTVVEQDRDSIVVEDSNYEKHIWNFVYYDPYYECRRAYNEGKVIQFKSLIDDVWCDCGILEDLLDNYEYRIKPEEESKQKRMTYRQLAEWLAKGNGEYSPNRTSGMSYITFEYRHDLPEEEVPDSYKICRWGSDEWLEPTVDEYLKDCGNRIKNQKYIEEEYGEEL